MVSLQKKNKAKKPMSLQWKSTWQLSLLSLPGFVWYIIFAYIPMIGIVIAFQDFNYIKGIFGSKWVGFDNFVYLFLSNDAVRILRNTVLYNIAFIVVGTTAAITVALLLDSLSKKSLIKTYQTSMFLPYFISWVVVAYVSQALFNYETGVFNVLLNNMGKEPVPWFTSPKPWPIIIILAQLWKGIGFSTIIYYGSIIGIDQTLYEAATIDGATKAQKIFKITLPLLKPSIIVLFIMSIGNMMRADFGLFYYVPGNAGPLYPVVDVLDTYIYRVLKVAGDIPSASAAAFFQSVVGLILVVTANTIVKKVDSENSLF